jgi:hypothetical protein
MKIVRLGSGAGFSGDRIEPAVELAEKGDIDYLVFECLAERTIALAQQARRLDPDGGYDPLLEARMRAVLPICARKKIRIITNMGAANPLAAARRTAEIAKELGLKGLRVAAVLGDDVADAVRNSDAILPEIGRSVRDLGASFVSANAYLGAEPIVAALAQGAEVVITGRAADPALFLAPLVHEFGWADDDWAMLGRGVLVGHLLECAGQITGGYFADPGFKDVAGLARLGFPVGIVDASGDVTITKPEGSGGQVTEATCKEQVLYEIHDPARYMQPDCVADFSRVRVEQIGPDRVRMSGAFGSARPPTLKVSVGYVDSWIGEGQISYAGPGALERGRLALEIVRERFEITGLAPTEARYDLIGADALHGAVSGAGNSTPYEVRVRVVARTTTRAEAARVGEEVESLYTNGPAGGGGVWKAAREVVAVASLLLPREAVTPRVEFVGAGP